MTNSCRPVNHLAFSILCVKETNRCWEQLIVTFHLLIFRLIKSSISFGTKFPSLFGDFNLFNSHKFLVPWLLFISAAFLVHSNLYLNFCSRFIFRSIFFCFFSSTSGCSFFWLSHGWSTDPQSIQIARNGANSKRNQNQFDVSDSTWVPAVRMIRSFTFLWRFDNN